MGSNGAIGRMPVSLFGIVLGLAGTGLGWRAAARLWAVPASISQFALAAAVLVWLVLIVLYAWKWLFYRSAALAEVRHPIQCCFVGLIGIATLLIALVVLPYSRDTAFVLFLVGASAQFIFGVWRTGAMFRGGRNASDTTAVMYLPLVGGNFVSATVAGTLGLVQWGQLFFGAGLFAWFAVESIVLHRLYLHEPLPKALRPTLGILLAPPTVGCVAYLSITSGAPDLGASLLFGYGLLMALVLLRIAGWILEQPFGASYWAFSFGITALPLSAFRMIERGQTGPIAMLALPLFVVSNALIAAFFIGTLKLLIQGRLLPPAPIPPVVADAGPAGVLQASPP